MNKLIILPLLFLFSGVVQATAPLTDLSIVPEVSRHSAPDFVLENLRGGNAGLADYKGKIFIKHLYGPMFFGFTSHFHHLLSNLSEDVKILIIRMDRVPNIDQSGLYAMEEAILDLQNRNVVVLLSFVIDAYETLFA